MSKPRHPCKPSCDYDPECDGYPSCELMELLIRDQDKERRRPYERLYTDEEESA